MRCFHQMSPATVDGEEEDRPDWEHESPGQEAAQKKEEPGQDAAHTKDAPGQDAAKKEEPGEDAAQTKKPEKDAAQNTEPGTHAAQKKEPGEDAAQNETPVALNLREGPTGKIECPECKLCFRSASRFYSPDRPGRAARASW